MTNKGRKDPLLSRDLYPATEGWRVGTFFWFCVFVVDVFNYSGAGGGNADFVSRHLFNSIAIICVKITQLAASITLQHSSSTIELYKVMDKVSTALLLRQ